MKTTFRKREKLRSKKAFNELIKLGRSFYSQPFLIIWKKTSPKEKYPAQVAVSVSKKLLKRAVDMNIIKRRTSFIFWFKTYLEAVPAPDIVSLIGMR